MQIDVNGGTGSLLEQRSEAGSGPLPDETDLGPLLDDARREIETLTRRLHSVGVSRDVWRGRYEASARERDRDRARLAEVERSEPYRLARAVVWFTERVARRSPRRMRAATERAVKRCLSFAERRWSRRGHSGAAPSGPASVPGQLYVALGFDLDGLRGLLRVIQQYLLIRPEQVPVVVTDCPQFSLLRHFGIVLEYVPDRQSFERHGVEVDWHPMLGERLALIRRDHRCTRTVVVEPGEVPTLSQLIRLDAATR